MNRNSILKTVALLMLITIPAMASGSTAGNTAFGTFANGIIGWLTGNLGYVIAIFAFFGSLIIYAFTHKGAVVVIGLIIAVLVGGGVGITRTFFSQGKTAFSSTATF